MNTRKHAVVLGGSVAGMLAARVLSDTHENVTIVERDRLPAGAAHRRGVPQGHHAHGILPSGLRIMEDLLPGITDQMIADGGLPGDILGNTRWYLNGRLLRQAMTGLTAISASRPLIEGAVRGRVVSLSNVTVLDGYDIVGVCSTPDRGRITGARVTGLHGQGSRILSANLVVDATGRGSRASRWLAELGYDAPPRDEVGIDLTYVTRLFEEAPAVFGDDVLVATARFPGQRRSSVIQRLEGGRTLVTLGGILGERPPSDLDGYIAYAETLAAPDTFELVRSARPIGDPIPFRCPTYTRRRYERLTQLPAGLLVIGDAVCAFNPVYGQGMSAAALSVAVLAQELTAGSGSGSGDLDPYRYFAAVARAVDAPWGLAVGADLAVAGVTGPVLPKSPLTGEYIAKLQLAASEDASLAAAFIRVTSLVDPPSVLLRPDIAEKVARGDAALAAA